MSDDKKMTLVEHLDELRGRIIYSVASVIVVALVAYFFRQELLEILARPLQIGTGFSTSDIPAILQALEDFFRESGQFTEDQITALVATFRRLLFQSIGLIFIHPTEAFFTFIKLSLFTGLVFSMPFIIYQIWEFVVPALFDQERRFLFGTFFFGTLLFFAGTAFAFLIVLPIAISFLIRISGPQLSAVFTVGNYVSFTMLFILVFGILFELPVVIFMLVRVGITSRAFLIRQRKYMVLIAFIVGAALTPPDVITQAFLAIPLILLFEVSLIVARFAERRRRRAAEEIAGEAETVADEARGGS